MPLKLPRLQRSVEIVDSNMKPAFAFHQWWQSFANAIETAFNTLSDTVAAVAAAQAAADAATAAAATANTAATTANTAATVAQAAADGADASSSLATSGASGLTITATDAGANVTITISAHNRIYGNGTSVAVTGGSLTALAYSTTYYIYYDQASRLGGAVTYQSTTALATAAQTGDRHSLGAVTTPAAAAPPVTGNNNLPPGVVEP